MALPSGYTKLDYIESSGTQYINTGVKPNQKTRVLMDVEVRGTKQCAPFGARASQSGTTYTLFLMTATTGRTDYGTSKQTMTFSSILGRYTIDANKNVVNVNGVSITHTASTFSVDHNIFLLAVNTAGKASNFAKVKLYSCKIYDNGTLVRDFIPCKNASGTLGLWDNVNSVFYANAGTGTFSTGTKHKTLIDGVGYEIKSGRVLIAGTGYGIKKGRTLIGGTGYDIKFATPIGELPAGTKNLPFDMGVGAGKVPYSLCCYTDEEGQSWIYILDAGKQFTYTATGETDGGDGKITVMKVDGTGTNVMVTNIGGAAYNDPYYGLVDGSDLIYSDRNTGLRSMPLKTRGAKEESNYVMNNQWLGYYNKSYSYGAMSTSLYKDKAGIYWWGKCFNGNGIYRFKWSDKVDDYAKAQAPYKVVLSGVKLKGFTIDETRGHLYVWRWQSDDGFYQYPLPAADASIVAKDFTARATMIAEMGCNNADEGLYCTQMALDSETGDVYFGFNKDSGDKSIYATGLKRFNYATSKVESIDVCGEKILGIVINDNKTKLF